MTSPMLAASRSAGFSNALLHFGEALELLQSRPGKATEEAWPHGGHEKATVTGTECD
jgi:hypothetical protein